MASGASVGKDGITVTAPPQVKRDLHAHAEMSPRQSAVAGFACDVVVGAEGAIRDLFKGVVNLVTHPLQSLKGLVMLPVALVTRPADVARVFTEPYSEALRTGHPGRAIGRGIIEIGNLALGVKTVAGLLRGGHAGHMAGTVAGAADAAGQAAQHAGHAGQAARSAGIATQAVAHAGHAAQGANAGAMTDSVAVAAGAAVRAGQAANAAGLAGMMTHAAHLAGAAGAAAHATHKAGQAATGAPAPGGAHDQARQSPPPAPSAPAPGIPEPPDEVAPQVEVIQELPAAVPSHPAGHSP